MPVETPVAEVRPLKAEKLGYFTEGQAVDPKKASLMAELGKSENTLHNQLAAKDFPTEKKQLAVLPTVAYGLRAEIHSAFDPASPKNWKEIPNLEKAIGKLAHTVKVTGRDADNAGALRAYHNRRNEQ